jgi:hypothetical protein
MIGLPHVKEIAPCGAMFPQVVEPARAEFGELDQVSVWVADRRDARLSAEFGWRVAESDATCLKPLDQPGQVEDHEGQLDGAGRGGLALVVGHGVDGEMNVTKLARPVQGRISVPFPREREPEHIAVEVRELFWLLGYQD